jgi:hypothetical protein
MSDSLSDAPTPILLQGNATVTEIFTQARLEVLYQLPHRCSGADRPAIVEHNCGAYSTTPPVILQSNASQVSAGLAISIILFLLAQGSTDDHDIRVNGTGILHAIWLYRNHPELDTLLVQVEYPTDDNLRSAGLVQTRLLGGPVQKEESNESF